MHKRGRHGHQHEDREARHVHDEEVEELVIVEANAVVDPRAVVIHVQDTPFAERAVMCPGYIIVGA